MIKTVSLELAKELKAAGFRQVSEYYHVQYSDDVKTDRSTISRYRDLPLEYQHPDEWHDNRRFAAPSGEEILERLPIDLAIQRENKRYSILHVWDSKGCVATHAEFDDTLAEAAGKMWLYLKQNGALATPK